MFFSVRKKIRELLGYVWDMSFFDVFFNITWWPLATFPLQELFPLPRKISAHFLRHYLGTNKTNFSSPPNFPWKKKTGRGDRTFQISLDSWGVERCELWSLRLAAFCLSEYKPACSCKQVYFTSTNFTPCYDCLKNGTVFASTCSWRNGWRLSWVYLLRTWLQVTNSVLEEKSARWWSWM